MKGKHMTPLREVPERIRQRKPFKGSSLVGRIDPDGSYVVVSYDTQMLRIAPDGGIHYNADKYSRTTSKHQYYIRQGIGI
jgi:hypothetical protein